MPRRYFSWILAVAVYVPSVPSLNAALSFPPGVRFQGASLSGWHILGNAQWQAQNGEITGKGAGWLILNHPYQDIGFHASFRCSPNCETGVLFRAEKTSGGWRGIYLSLAPGDIASYSVLLDSQGKILTKEKLPRGGGTVRIAPPPKPASPSQRHRFPTYSVVLPFTRPNTDLRPDDWNEVEIFCDANIVRAFLNNGSEIAGGVIDETAASYGPFALYVNGGDARFRDLAYKDLADKKIPPEKISPAFRMQRLDEMYYSWSAAAGDFDRDGVLDVVAGPHIYYGPDFKRSREIYSATALNPSKDFASVNCQYAFDFNGDGWTDILTGPPRATLYINPKGELRRWDKYEVVTGIQTEITVLKDIDGDGIPELIYGAEGSVRYAKPDPADPTKPWIVHQVSAPGYSIAHGIGAGDINGDGRVDIVNPFGWWEQPPVNEKEQPWTYHPEIFARYGHGVAGGSVMAVYDANGDGLNDVVASLNAHGFGFAWFEQKRDRAGKISFVRHMISDDYSAENAGGVTFSQPHGSTVADVDGDGVPDFIVGKRYWTHLDNYFDPDPYGQPVLYWYRTVRNPKAPGGAAFVPELIHNRSGAGSDILAVDLNRDGLMDVVTSTRFGTFVFFGKPSSKEPRQ